ncbi:MAG: hypothetical protein UW69_C0054G0002 [Microgenomates group bacterium GW2011_GWA2_44_7]|nr:MAG: hypothetical protein UW69_C0054G0002 [Microgenomates group bacterium GW2011_GWA2_44_7]KKT77323.1 MAG: hypothetical protein UW73_C0023G0028 [Microgenomates group bacterium GW2011_GWB1_44_8]
MPKCVYGNLYVHKDFFYTLTSETQKTVAIARPLLPKGRPWNIVRINTLHRNVSFSYYPQFDENPHPELKNWTKIDLVTKQVKCGIYTTTNPFILHLKEAFVDENHPLYAKFRNLSVQEKEAGLYEPPHGALIGRKTYWENLLARKGLVIIDHQLKKHVTKPSATPQMGLFTDNQLIKVNETLVMSGKTAMHRSEPSLPAKILVERKIVNGRLFDWGCGHGADLDYFLRSGIKAEGWDPNHKPDKPPQSYPPGLFRWVHCSFVLNTLPDPGDRTKILEEIFNFLPAGGNLAISVRSAGEIEDVRKATWQRFNDGWLTSKNTFQKGFLAKELKDLLIDKGFTVSEIVLSEPVVFILARKI